MRRYMINVLLGGVALLPFFAQYAGLNESILAHDLVLLISFPLLLLFANFGLVQLCAVGLVFYIIFIGGVWFIVDSAEESLLRTFRVAFYILYAFFLSSVLSSKDVARLRVYILLAASLVGLFVVVQVLSKFIFDVYPGFYLPGVQLSRSEIYEHLDYAQRASFIRPRGGLGEPSQVGIFLGVVLVYFGAFGRISFPIKIILIAGLVLSVSLTAYFFLLVYFVIYYVRKVFQGNALYKVVLVPLGISSIFGVALLIVSQYERISYRFLNRIRTDFWPDQDGFRIFFGGGYGSELVDIWLASGIRYFSAYGLFGVVFFMFCLSLFLKSNRPRHTLFTVGLFAVVSMFTELLVSHWVIVFFAVYLASPKKSSDLKKVCYE